MAVVVLLADGLRADTLRRAIDDGVVPAMSRLLQRGGLYEVTSAFPSVTGPAYTPFLLGRFPGPVGLPGLRWFDRSRKVCSFPGYSRSYVGYEMRAADADLDATAPTIFELVPGSAAAMTIVTRGLPRSRRLSTLTARSALRAMLTHFGGTVDPWLDVDRDTSRKVVQAVRDGSTPFLFAAFMGIDKISHARGHEDPGIAGALRIMDDTVGALLGLRQPESLRIWIASDHGHSRVSHHDDLQRLITDRGHRTMAHPWVHGRADVAVMVSGNAMAHIYVELEDRKLASRRKLSGRWTELAEWLARRESVDLMMIPQSESSCLVCSRARGRAAIRVCGSTFSYDAGEGDPLGVGTDLREVSAAEAHEATRATDYPDSIVQIARLATSERAGDVILSATRGWDFRERYEPIRHVSSHGALHRDHMLVPLLLDTPVARVPRRTADVMPSALTVLGVSVPGNLDGESFLAGQSHV
jgi:hypothetical protein